MNRDKVLFTIFLVLTLNGCKTSKEKFYSYEVNTYTIDTGKTLLNSNKLISYCDFLFEFKMKKIINNVLHGESKTVTTSVKEDTIGVYLIDSKTKLYYEFDTFALKCTMVETGKLIDKPFGLKLTPATGNTDTTKIYAPLEKSVVNNIPCFFSEIVSKNKTMADSITIKVLMLKDANFNSVYKINGVKYTDKNYCIAGLSIYYNNQKQGVLDEIDALRPLNEKEKEICENMVAKSRKYIIDTIKVLNAN